MVLKDLHIIDLSEFIYAGSVNKYAKITGELKQGHDGWYQPTISTGGVAFLFKRLVDILSTKGDVVIAADRPPTQKRLVQPDYKENRKRPKETIRVQKEIAEEILKDCGYAVVAAEGYEADDVIYTIAKRYGNRYRAVFVHAEDSDLYSLVNRNTGFLNVRENGKCVTLLDYEQSVKRDKIVPYNTLPYVNMVYGKTKDNTRPLPQALEEEWDTLFVPENYINLGDTEWVLEKAKEIGPVAYNYAYVSYPLYLPELEVPQMDQYDPTRVREWAYTVGYRKINKPWISATVDEKVKSLLDTPEYLDED